MVSRHRLVSYHQAAFNGVQDRFNAVDVRTMIRIDQSPDRGLAQAQTLGQGNIGNALAAHSCVECQFGGNDGWEGDQDLAVHGSAWDWDVFTVLDVCA